MSDKNRIVEESEISHYLQTVEETLNDFEVDKNIGLSKKEAENRYKKFGPNKINTHKRTTLFQAILTQIKSPLVLVLIGVIVLKTGNLSYNSFIGDASIQDIVEVLLVFTVVVISTWIGVSQELSAEKALSKLRSQIKFVTKVIRDREIKYIDSVNIVPGDIVILEMGDRVPGDCRVIESIGGKVNESILTGESEEITKKDIVYQNTQSISDRKNMVYAGTNVIEGKLMAVVCKTGQNTEFGKISKSLEETKQQKTKFQKQTTTLLSQLTITSLICFIILQFFYIFILMLDPIASIETGLALIISFIPEALSAVTVIVLSISASSLAKKGIIIKNLAAAEGMGSINTFLTDKTGTITNGKMEVKKVWFIDKEIQSNQFKGNSTLEKEVLDILKYCNNNKGSTEAAFTQFIKNSGVEVNQTNRIKEYSYNSHTKRMTVIKDRKAYTKGAGDILLPLCKSYLNYNTEKEELLNQEIRGSISAQIEKYSANGLRVLLLAKRTYSDNYQFGSREKDENNLTFCGLICMYDPLRPEVDETVAKFKESEINLVMITGDHPNIAGYLAEKAGIIDNSSDVISGAELNTYTKSNISDIPKEIRQKLLNNHVYARVTPNHKNFLVEFYKQNGRVVAMAGDGVNDAIAIKKADIGIAVKNAVDWVRDIAGIVVAEGFDSLIKAVEEGRKVIYRARLFSHYLLSGNISQVGVFILVSIFSGIPPLTSLQLLIINLLTDTLPAIAMAYEKVPESVLTKKPEDIKTNLVNKQIWTSIIIQGGITSLFLFAVFNYFIPNGIFYAQTTVFFGLFVSKTLQSIHSQIFYRIYI